MASPSSSPPSQKKYDVFISFRGEDTWRSFVGPLNTALARKGITTFKDVTNEDVLSVSDVLSFTSIAVVVMSENYASSRMCLDELRMVMKLRREEKLTVFPVFYGVDPSDVKLMKGSFWDAFHGFARRETQNDVQIWTEALTQISDLSGMDSGLWKTDEALNESTVELISAMLASRETVSATPVGIDRQVKAILRLLDSESDNKVHFVGICGEAGVGKTTLARHVYETISDNFNVHVFLENLKQIDQKHGLSHSLEESLSQSRDIKREAPRVGIADVGSDVFKPRLRNRKVLVVADGLEDTEELRYVADEASKFGPGSAIIVTTRDQSLLRESGITHIYEVECLRYDEALQLFCRFAFKQEYPPPSFEQLSVHAIQLSGCLPLALKVLGSSLQGKDERDWKRVLQKIEESSAKGPKALTEVLRLSYRGEDDKNREASALQQRGEGVTDVSRPSHSEADEQNYFSSFILSFK